MGAGKRGNNIIRSAAGCAAVVAMSFLFNSVCAQVVDTMQIGNTVANFLFRGNPELLNGKIINVTDTMVAMSEWFWSQSSKDTSITNGEPPAIMFVIDNSGSMYGEGGTSDPNAYRFSITRQFLDTVYAKYPNAKVGLAVFGTHLWFDPNDSNAAGRYPFISKFPFKQVLPQYQNDDTGSNRGAYVPLLQLNSVYANYGGLTGLKLLDTILVTANSTNPNNHTDLRYSPSAASLRSGIFYSTNLTAGFDAAKSAMAATTTSRCSQFVILLSDGGGNRPDGTYNGDNGVPRGRSRYFMDSVQNDPTTFTVFFPATATLTSSLGLRLIDTMTRRIRVNGYDLSEPADSGCTGRSNYWPGNPANLWTNFTTMWSIITIPNQTQPEQITVNGQTVTSRSGDTAFQFSQFIPLTGHITPVNVDLTYFFFQNNKQVGDTTVHLSYNIQTLPHGSSAWSPYRRDSFDISTWDRDLRFRYHGVPIDTITETMDSIELYFTFDSGTAKYGYDGAPGLGLPVDIYNMTPFATGYANDHEIVYLQRGAGNVFSGIFKRQVSGVANPGDGVLQYQGAADHIVAVFRNAESDKIVLPLDTLRKCIGFDSIAMHLSVTDTTITAGDTTHPIRAIVTDALGHTVDSTWVLPKITYTLVPATSQAGDALVLKPGQWGRFTGTRADTNYADARQIIVTLTDPANGATISATLRVRIKPAPPAKLWLEATSTPNMYTPNVKERVVFGSTQIKDSVFAVLRDRFLNLVSFSDSTAWLSYNLNVVTVTDSSPLVWRGILTKGGTTDSAWVRATNLRYPAKKDSLKDSVWVVFNNVTYDSLMIMRDVSGTGTLVQIHQLYDTLPNVVTLYVYGHRSDGLGGNGGWGPVSGNWSLTAGLQGKTTVLPPSNQSLWTFAPNDTGGAGHHDSIFVSLPGGPRTFLNPVVFIAGLPNTIGIYPHSGTPDVSGNMEWPAAPAVADTMSADSLFSLLSAKLFYNTGSNNKIIWLSQYETNVTLADQITWTVTPPDEDTIVLQPTYYCFAQLIARQAFRNVTVTAHWNALSYSMVIYVVPGAINHLVIEASPAVPNRIHDDPLASIIMQSNQRTGSAYAILRDKWGNYVHQSINAQWASTDITCFTAARGDTTIGQGIATRVADQCQSQMIACDNVAVPGKDLCDSVPVILNDITHLALHIYDYDPNKDTAVTAISLPTGDSLTLYVEGQRSDDTTLWEPVTAMWLKDASLDTRTNPPGTGQLWNVIANATGSGWIKATRNEGTYFITDSVWAVFTEGSPASVALYRGLGDPATVPLFPAIDTVTAGAVDTVFAKIFDVNGKWLNRFETNIPLSQQVISWTIQSVGQNQGPDTTLGSYTGRMTTFSPHIAYSLYRVTATFHDSVRTFSASAEIYVKPGAAQHISVEAQLVPPTNYGLLVGDHPAAPVHLGPRDTTNTQIFAIIRDQYGNFVDYSHNPSWVSRDLTVDTATDGPQAVVDGQGKIIRGRTGSGSAYNIARDLNNISLRPDSVLAILDSLQYDALRITFRDPLSQLDTVPIHTRLTLQTGQVDSIYVQGLLSNGQWVDVPGNWNYVAEHNTESGTTISYQPWVFPVPAVDTTHNGRITVTMGNLSTSIPVTITVGAPDSLVLYSDSAAPGGSNVRLPNPPQFMTLTAGTTAKLAALVFDSRGVWLDKYLTNQDTAARISWSASSRTFNQDVSSMFSNSGPGAVKYFTSTRAYDTVVIIASLSTTLRDTVVLVVQPAAATHIVLEKTDQYWNHLRTPDPCDTLTILDNEQNGSVFAILRDQYGNAVAPYYATLVRDSSSNPDSIGVTIPLSYQLEALRINSGSAIVYAMIYAWDGHGNGDSCVVRLVPYRYIALRIVNSSGTPYPSNPGSPLTMNTNQDSTIYVQGQRSDDLSWESVSALWEILPRLQTVLPGSGRNSHPFTLSPTDTGTGWIRVTRGNMSEIPPDTLWLDFTAGSAVRATITILTPPNQRIAGQPIKYVDSLFNADGRLIEMATLSSTPSAYHDTIGRGGLLRPEPFILVDGSTVHLDTEPWGSSNQQFTNGVDTGSFTLYYAPLNPAADSLHQIFASFVVNGNTLTAHTEPFALLSAPLASIEMDSTSGGGHQVVGPDTLYYNDLTRVQIMIFAVGYDQYHNNKGTVSTDWDVTDSLHKITSTNPQTNIIYSAAGVPQDEGGWIEVKYPADTTISDRVFVYIHGPFITLDSAVTGDWSGNGLLDHMTLYFNKTASLPQGFTFQGITITYGNVSFTVDSVLNTGASGRVWTLALKEVDPGDPQTAWRPIVSFPNQSGVHIDAASVTSLDGAGPVVWKVDEYRTSSDDRTHDTVIVTFSEPVKEIDGNHLNQQNTNPSAIFYVWRLDTTGSQHVFIRDSMMLAGITDLRGGGQVSTDNTQVRFFMYNGQDLTNYNYFSIDTEINKYVVDDSRGNKPNANNQKVQVNVHGAVGPIIPAPNPATAYVGYPDNGLGQFHAVENPNAPQWVDVQNGGHGGAMFLFTFQQPEKGSQVGVECQIKIYDLVGNLVQSDYNPDFYNSDKSEVLQSNGLVTSHIYWNCTNAKGMVVAAGVYRVVAYLHYKDIGSGHEAHRFPDEKKIAQLGVAR